MQKSPRSQKGLTRLATRLLFTLTFLIAPLLLSACQPFFPGQPSGLPPQTEAPAPEPAPPTDPQPPTDPTTPVGGESPAPDPVPTPQPAEPTPEPPAPVAEPGPLPEVPLGEPSQFVVHGDRSCKQIAFTYDAGSGADGAEAILDMLKKHDLKVTFFLTGKWVEQYPELARRIAAEGHEIANHSYSHPDLTTIPDEEVLKQIKDGEEAIRRVTGVDPKPLFREPYGAFNEHERRLVRQAGYSYSVYWDLDTLDWQFPGVETLTQRLLKAQGGSVVLMHLNVLDSATASDQVIPILQEQGYQIVKVSQLLQCQGE